MDKPRKQNSGLPISSRDGDSPHKPNAISRNQPDKIKLAAELSHQGRLREAQAIYIELISAGTSNHIVYGNYAQLCRIEGNLHECIKLLRKAINLNPNYIFAHMSLGNALQQQGNLTEAINSYKNTLNLKPNYHQAHYNLGLALQKQGDLNGSIDSYKTSLRLNPNSKEAHNNLGLVLKAKGDLSAAIDAYKNALQLNSDYPEAHYNLGIALKDQGDLSAAIDSYKTALHLNPNYPEAQTNLGNAFQQQGNLTAAINSYKASLKLNPNSAEAHYNLGIALQEQGDLTAAISAYKTALHLNPNYSEAHNNLGNALQQQGHLNAAIDSYRNALRLKHNFIEAHNNLGLALQEHGELAAAISSYKTALHLDPNYSEAHNNLGLALQINGDLSSAITSYKTALDLNPNYTEAHKNLSLCLLLAGDYTNGWQEGEWRLQQKNKLLYSEPKCKQWDGTIPQKNKKLILVSEQGLGDTLQFMRYTNILKYKGFDVSLCAPPKLHTLIQVSGVDSSPLTPDQANQVTSGQWIPLLSVPRHLKVSPNNPIINEPYIKTTGELQEKWKNILSVEKKPIIGINWQGNPNTEKTSLRGRSLTLETFAALASNEHLSLLSLQKGFGSDQLDTCSFKNRFVNCQDQISATWDFLETAAIIANCDLVITSDTSVAHLAGGMGKATWLLLHKVPDWRWGLEGTSTFWYPSIRLFRQQERGKWNGLMTELATALQERLSDTK